jgi:Family of unknown function (DUF6065)
MTQPTLTAYHLYSGEPTMKLVPASRNRAWMDATPQGFSKRCLPLLIANASGWHILNSHAITVTWNGGIDKSALRIEADSAGPGLAVSHFGSGVITWNIPFLLRTSPGYNLLVRGPANMPKDGISALEGIVETDWSSSTFTMNWKVTRPNEPITFAVGEPIAQLVPQKRGELESFTTRMRPVTEDLALLRDYTNWSQERGAFLTDLNVPGSEACKREWQKDYFQAPGIAEHQTKLKLMEFQGDNAI